jgi:glycosyltransferase involved in cell wall biosynthesis
MSLDNPQPLITIGITCFNAEDTITRAVTSAFKQNWPNLEIVIVDDCSTDSSIAVIENLIKDQPTATLVCHETNQGPAVARNTILAHARGEFVAFIDDDDESLPERVATQYRRILDYEKDVDTKMIACYASGYRVYPNGYQLALNAIGSRPIVPQGPAVANYLLFYGKKPGWFYGTGTPTCSLMGRRSIFEAVGGFDTDFQRFEDMDFSVRLALAGTHFIGCPEPLFIQHSTEASDKSQEKNLESDLLRVEKHKDYLKSVGRYEYSRQWPRIRYYHMTGQRVKMLSTLFVLFLQHPIHVFRHFMSIGPRRFLHERKMRRPKLS